MQVIFENPYGRTLADETDEVYCVSCGGWCKPQACSCTDCRAAWEEYRESLQSEDSV